MSRTHAFLTIAAVMTAPLGNAALAQPKPINEHFATTWKASTTPSSYGETTDGTFKEDGNYCVSYGSQYSNELNSANVTFSSDQFGPMLNLVVQPGTHSSQICHATAYGASEIATTAGWKPTSGAPPFGPSTYGYGYYQVRMRPSCVQGEISSFFWISAPSYGPLEIDVEFPDPAGHVFNDVHWTIHPSGETVDYPLGFNPCEAFHDYGFRWTPGQVTFTVDGADKQIFTNTSLNSTQTGFVMANAWTGNPSWGGGPPTTAAVNSYRWIAYTPWAGNTASQ